MKPADCPKRLANVIMYRGQAKTRRCKAGPLEDVRSEAGKLLGWRCPMGHAISVEPDAKEKATP